MDRPESRPERPRPETRHPKRPCCKALLSQNPIGRPTAHQPPPDLDDVIAGMMAQSIQVTVSNLAEKLGVGRATAGRYLQKQRAVAQAETR